MTLTLLAVSLNDQPLSQPITAHFDGSGGTIGRADHNTMALPDPERHISRLQAEVVASGDAFVIRNVGAANPITVAGRTLGRGDTAPLGHGDEVRIGGYLLQVDGRSQSAALDVTRGRARLSEAGGAAGPATLGGAPLARTTTPITTPTFPAFPTPSAAAMSPSAPATGNNPFADLFAPAAQAAPGPGPAATGPRAPAQAARPAAASDPFADLFGAAGGPLPPPPPAPPLAAPPKPAPVAADPFPDALASLLPPPAGLPASSAAFERPRPPPGARLPDHFDPFASLPGPAAAPQPATDPFAALMPVAAPASIDTLFGLGGGAVSADPLANFMAGAPPAPATGSGAGAAPLAGAPGLSADPFAALFGGAPVAPAAPTEPDHVPALNAAFAPPRLRSVTEEPPAAAPLAVAQPAAAAPTPPPQLPPPPPPPPLSPPAAAPPAAALRSPAPPAEAAQQLWAALCQGAGIHLPLPAGGGAAQMHDIGRILRSAVDGTLRLMAVRTSTRHEMRANVTVIQPRNNNPLKFSPDADAALEALLQPSVRGFLEGPAAMEDAMQDLVGHSIGSVAGMRAALEGVLDRFAPEQLESRLTTKSVLDNVLPAARKARLWDLFLQHQGTIRDDAQDDFHALFGKAFLAAYEQQVAQLKRNARAAQQQQPPAQGAAGPIA